MVTILSVALMLLTAMEQERRTSPLMCTEQAPHCATPQPYFVPVSPTCSRMTQSRGVSSSTCTSRVLPLILSFAMSVPLRVALTAISRCEVFALGKCRPDADCSICPPPTGSLALFAPFCASFPHSLHGRPSLNGEDEWLERHVPIAS